MKKLTLDDLNAAHEKFKSLEPRDGFYEFARGFTKSVSINDKLGGALILIATWNIGRFRLQKCSLMYPACFKTQKIKAFLIVLKNSNTLCGSSKILSKFSGFLRCSEMHDINSISDISPEFLTFANK